MILGIWAQLPEQRANPVYEEPNQLDAGMGKHIPEQEVVASALYSFDDVANEDAPNRG